MSNRLSRRLLFIVAVGLQVSCMSVIRAQAQDTQHPPPMAAARNATFEHDFESSDAPLTLYRATGKVVASNYMPAQTVPSGLSREYQRVCTANCVLPLTEGPYEFALGTGSPRERVISVDGSYQLTGGETLIGHVDTKSTLHVAGWVLFALGAIGAIGVPTLIAGTGDGIPKAAPVITSVLVGAALSVLGIFMAFQPPTAEITLWRRG